LQKLDLELHQEGLPSSTSGNSPQSWAMQTSVSRLAKRSSKQISWKETHHWYNILQLQELFDSYHNTVFFSGKYKIVVNDKKKAKEDAKAKNEAHHVNQGNNPGNMNIRITMNTGSMIDVIQMIIKDMIANPHAMKARVACITVTMTLLITMTQDTPRTKTKARTTRMLVIKRIMLRTSMKESQVHHIPKEQTLL